MDTIENSQTEQFTGFDIDEFQNKMLWHNYSLKAFGSLLEYADLERFGNDFNDADSYRAGLNGIIEMFVEKQERIVGKMVLKFNQSPESIIADAAGTCEFLRQGVYRTHEDAFNKINSTVKKLNEVIAVFGEKYPKAETIKTELMDLKEKLTQSTPVQDLQKAG